MENYEAFVGFDLCKIPLSSVAQKIMSAMRSGDLVESKNWRESENTADVVGKSSARCSALPEDGRDQALGTKDLNSFTSQTSRASIKLSSQSSSIRLTGQLSADQRQNVSSLAPSSCLMPQCNQEASVLQRKEHERKHFLKQYINNENKESLNLKRKGMTCNNSPEKISKHSALREADEVEASPNSGDLREFRNHLWDVRYLNDLEKSQLIETLKQAGALVVTLMYKDGSTQLRADQAPVSSVKGVVMLVQRHSGEGSSSLGASASVQVLEEGFVPHGRCIYIKTEHSAIWSQEQEAHNQFARNMLFQILKCNCPVICFNAKDFVRTVLQFVGGDGSWKHAAGFVGLDPRIAAWLIDPSDAAPSFEDLVAKYFGNSITVKVSSTYGNSSRATVNQNVCANLKILYQLTMYLCSQLKSRLKELEQEAHFVAGEQFLVTSSNQLREILFGKLKLHLLSPAETLPRTELRGHLSTSEAVLNALQDFHPLPKIILEYRQVHKIKSTFVDGLLACTKKGSISSTWNQTGTVTGRLSAKHPNIQGISKHPIQVTRPQNYKDFSQIELRILAHLSGDPELLKLFQESERDDVFSTLTSQWKDIPTEHVTHTDREQTKKVVYAVVYGAGKERLAACLGVTLQEASQFLESFLQKYRKIKDFAQETIARCHQTGYVTSIMGRRRPLPRIHAQDQQLRAQAERQAVNFVVQGSAADLCKMAMIHTFAAVAASPTLTARLVAQIHDELLFEVEDSQVPEFAGPEHNCPMVTEAPGAIPPRPRSCPAGFTFTWASTENMGSVLGLLPRLLLPPRGPEPLDGELGAWPDTCPALPSTGRALVRGAMESLQHVRALELQLQVPLKVSLSAGRSWGHLVPLQEAANPWPRPCPAESPSNHQATAEPLVSTCPPGPSFCL